MLILVPSRAFTCPHSRGQASCTTNEMLALYLIRISLAPHVRSNSFHCRADTVLSNSTAHQNYWGLQNLYFKKDCIATFVQYPVQHSKFVALTSNLAGTVVHSICTIVCNGHARGVPSTYNCNFQLVCHSVGKQKVHHHLILAQHFIWLSECST